MALINVCNSIFQGDKLDIKMFLLHSIFFLKNVDNYPKQRTTLLSRCLLREYPGPVL